MAVNAALTAKQRRNFLSFLNRQWLKRFLVFDDFHKKQPSRPGKAAGEGAPYPARISVAVRPTGEVA